MAAQVTNYQCPSCTGPLHFVGASGKLECDYCGSTYDVAEIEAFYAEKEEKAAGKKADGTAAGAAAANAATVNDAPPLMDEPVYNGFDEGGYLPEGFDDGE